MIEPINWLIQVAERLPELGADGERLGQALQAWLRPGAGSFEDCIGVARTARTVHWRHERDRALFELADELAGGLPILRQAAIARAALLQYATTRWVRVDQFRSGAPKRGVLLWRVLRANCGRVPSRAALRLLFSTQAISNAAGHNPLFGDENGPAETRQCNRPDF